MEHSLIAPITFPQVSLAQAGTGYTDKMDATLLAGEIAALVKVGGAGTVTINQQCSVDGVFWYNPVNSTGGAVSEVIASGGTAATTYRKFTMTITKYIRFRCVETNVGAATVDITLVFQE